MEESLAVAVGGDGRDFRGTLIGFAKADVGGDIEEDEMEDDGDDDASLAESSSNMLRMVY